MRKTRTLRECACQDDSHHDETPKVRGNHKYLAEKDDVALPVDMFGLARCYYCRVHHGARLKGDAK